MLADKVKGGELPPVADRLPTNPRVIDLPAMGRQIGKQGGRINSVIGSQKDIRFMSINGYSRLVGYDEKLQLVPDILDKFTIEDGRIFTLHLAQGPQMVGWPAGHDGGFPLRLRECDAERGPQSRWPADRVDAGGQAAEIRPSSTTSR